MRNKKTALLCAGLVFRSVLALAEIQLQSIQWQLARPDDKKIATAQSIATLDIDPGMPIKGKLQAKLTLLNRGAAVEGILLRYTLSARISPLSSPQEAVWVPPFVLESKRVPKVKANSRYDVSLDPSAALKLYLKRMYRAGYWPEELKLQVTLEPRRGDKGRLQTLETPLGFKAIAEK